MDYRPRQCASRLMLPAFVMYLDNKATTLRHEDSVHELWKVEGQLHGPKGNTRLPFGLCNGPSTFQKLMNEILTLESQAFLTQRSMLGGRGTWS